MKSHARQAIRAACLAFSLCFTLPALPQPSAPTNAPEPDRAEPELGMGLVNMLDLGPHWYQTRGGALSMTAGGSGSGVVSTSQTVLGGNSRSSEGMHFEWWLGGGQTGFDGGIVYDVDRGVRFPAEGHGVAIRFGIRGLIQGNDNYYMSRLELPQAAAGYQFLGRGRVVELLGRVGVLLDGRFRRDDEAKSNADAAPAWAALLNAGARPVFASTRLSRSGTLTLLDLELCSKLIEPSQACARYKVMAEGSTLFGFERRVSTMSLSVGFAPY